MDRLTVRVGGGRILSEAGDKGFGTGTLLSSTPGVWDEEQVRWGQCKAEESPIVGLYPTPAKLPSAHFHLLSDPNTASSGGWTQKWRFILSLCFHIGRTIPFSAAATCFSAPQINRKPTYIH